MKAFLSLPFQKKSSSDRSNISLLSSFRQFSLKEIIKATANFDETRILQRDEGYVMYLAKFKYGESKSGIVYASVKRFHTNNADGFENEVRIVTKTKHPNVISLLGYCLESDVRVLVYEYTEKGNLSNYVKKSSNFSLSWKLVLEICLGAACGLQYLHKQKGEFGEVIIHRSFHPRTILLDENWVAKVSHFDLSVFAQTFEPVETAVKGRLGYLAPEYLITGRFTNKIDVYGFGLVLFEVLCRELPWHHDGMYYRGNFEDIAVRAQEHLDVATSEGISDDSLKVYTDAIGRCLQSDPQKRPTMDQVVWLLQTAIMYQKGETELFRNIDPIAPRKAEVTMPASFSSYSFSSFTSIYPSSNLCTLPPSSSCPQFPLAEIEEVTDNFKSSCPQFPLAEIEEATDNFKVVLGKGGEASVYKAEIQLNSEKVRTPVAVKKLSRNSSEFEKEILTVGKIRHPNIVSLLGYCDESDEKILIYEYMGKGCLAAFMKKDNSLCLTWKQRLKICLDAAYGLRHLHEQTDEHKKGMIHRDVKPANILLDDNWVAKISDFGLLKLSNSSETDSTVISSNNNTGTAGYLAPEYVFFRRLSTKVDVYSFGLVMFEVLCRRKRWDLEGESNYSYMDENENIGVLAQENVDKQIKDDISYNSLKIFTDTIRDCLWKDPNKRPTMTGVVRLLESALKIQEGDDEQILNNRIKDLRVSEYDMSELESPFSIGNELKNVQLDHEVRAEYFGSLFTDIDNPLPDFHTAIFSWDASTLEIDDVKDVIRSCPAEDEMERLKNYNGDKEMLEKREQFFLELAKVPRLESKLRVFCFSMTLSHQVNDLRQSMETVNIAAIEVKRSRKLRQVIQIIGPLWNSLNQGTAPAFDPKFRLGSLLKLSKTRSKSSEMTMMHFLCKHLTEKKPELLDFDKDLVHLEAAAELQIESLAEEIQALREGLQNVEQEVKASDSDGFISVSFQKVMRSFLDTAEAEVNLLNSLYSEMRKNLDTLVQLLGEDPARCSFELVATTLLKFTRMFTTEHQLMVDLEKQESGTEPGPEEISEKTEI